MQDQARRVPERARRLSGSPRCAPSDGGWGDGLASARAARSGGPCDCGASTARSCRPADRPAALPQQPATARRVSGGSARELQHGRCRCVRAWSSGLVRSCRACGPADGRAPGSAAVPAPHPAPARHACRCAPGQTPPCELQPVRARHAGSAPLSAGAPSYERKHGALMHVARVRDQPWQASPACAGTPGPAWPAPSYGAQPPAPADRAPPAAIRRPRHSTKQRCFWRSRAYTGVRSREPEQLLP